jgi:SAM-dependent methyltransferase
LDAQYGKQYAELYRRHWWWRSREDALIRVLRRRFGAPPTPLNILDIGCGNGLFFDKLAEFGNVEGIEPCAELVDPSGKNAGKIHLRPFDETFSPKNKFDLLLMLDVLEHLDDPLKGLRCAHALLINGGSLLLTVPAFHFLWTNHDRLNQHRARYRRGTLFPLLREAGFLIMDSHYWYQWLFPAKLGMRLKEKIIERDPSPPRVPQERLNAALYAFSRMELETLGATRVPFGSSLMVFCQRSAAA